MQRLLAILLVMLLAFTVACGDDSDDDDGGDDADVPTPTLTTGTGTGGDATATTGDGGEEATEPAGNGGGEGDAAAGEELATSNGCVTCHSTDGSTLVGPTWQGLYGSEVELESGETVTADDAYITESIREPAAKIHAGFGNLMPPFDLDDEQIANIIAYIQTLE